MDKHISPALNKDSFHCPYCGVFAHQSWYELSIIHKAGAAICKKWDIDAYRPARVVSACLCDHCNKFSLWADDQILIPGQANVDMPFDDTPDDVAALYTEAMRIYNASPRSAAALLRVAVRRLTAQLGGGGKNMDDDFALLIKNGLLPQIGPVMRLARVTGDKAVPPGVIDPHDTAETAAILFNAINIIVRLMISHPKEREQCRGKLPPTAGPPREKTGDDAPPPEADSV